MRACTDSALVGGEAWSTIETCLDCLSASSARRRGPATRPRYHRPACSKLPTASGATHKFTRPPKPPRAETASPRQPETAPPQTHAGSRRDYTKTTRKKTRRADQPWVSPSPASGSACSARRRCVDSCAEIKILRRVRAESPRRPPRHRRDACWMAWRCRFLTARTEPARQRHRREMTSRRIIG